MPRALRSRLPWRWLAFGCLLPDVIDKPVWLLAHGVGSDLFDTARLFGHSIFLAAALAVVARFWRAPWVRALAYGVPTHLLLDVVTDVGQRYPFAFRDWLFWPLQLPGAALYAASVLRAFSSDMHSKVYLAGELVGALFLFWDLARRRR